MTIRSWQKISRLSELSEASQNGTAFHVILRDYGKRFLDSLGEKARNFFTVMQMSFHNGIMNGLSDCPTGYYLKMCSSRVW